MQDPDVFVIFKEGDSHGTTDGTMLTADVDERMARYRKVGRCVRYVPATASLEPTPEMKTIARDFVRDRICEPFGTIQAAEDALAALLARERNLGRRDART
jgi:hypothetical protein